MGLPCRWKDFPSQGVSLCSTKWLDECLAYVAIKTVLGRFSDATDLSYREMNRLIGVDHISRKVGIDGGGLSPQEMGDILDAAVVHGCGIH